jgi:hypothetical protein
MAETDVKRNTPEGGPTGPPAPTVQLHVPAAAAGPDGSGEGALRCLIEEARRDLFPRSGKGSPLLAGLDHIPARKFPETTWRFSSQEIVER